MKYTIIGLGGFGNALAEGLAAQGHEVIGIDNRPQIVDDIKDHISTAFVMDATERGGLSSLPIADSDLVIVCTGENFDATIRVIALLKKMGVKHICARAMDDVQYSVLEAFNLDRILQPEIVAAHLLCHELDLGAAVDVHHIECEYHLAKIKLPKKFRGCTVKDLGLANFKLSLLGVVKQIAKQNILGVESIKPDFKVNVTDDLKFEEGDVLVCYGEYKAIRTYIKAL